MIAQDIGMIQDRGEVEAGQIAMAYQNFIICLEMVLASIGLLYGFPHTDYKIGGPQAGSPDALQGVGANLKNVCLLHPRCRRIAQQHVYTDVLPLFGGVV
jgi:hypothetical protein